MASELEDEIRISESVLMGPLVLAKNLEEAYNVALKISSVKGVETFMKTGATATKQLRDETSKLAKDTQSLIGAQKSLATAIEADSKAYEEETKIIKELNVETKKQLTTSDTQVKKYQQLKSSLSQSRQEFAKHTTEESRATEESKKLLETIQKQEEELKKLREQLKNNNKEKEKEVSALTKLKAEYKNLQSQMIEVGAEFGVESQQFVEIAERAGVVKDEIGDLTEATNAVSGEPIERLSGSFDLFKGKLATLDVKGATAGIRGMTNAAKSLNFKEAISGAGGLTKAVGALGKALLGNPIFLIIAVVVGIGAALFALKDKIKLVSAAFELMGDILDWIVQTGKDFLDFVGLTTFAIDDMTVKIVEDLEKQRVKWEQLYDDQVKLASAAGKETLEIERKKQEAIAATTNFAINRLNYQKQYGSKLTEEQEKQLDELIKMNHDAEIEIKAIDLRIAKQKEDLAKEAAKKAKEERLREEGDAFKLQQFLLQNEIEKNKKIIADETKTYDARMDAVDKLIAKQKELALLEMDAAFNAEGVTNSGRKLAEAKLQQDLTNIVEEGEANRLAIIKSNQDQELKNTQEYVKQRKDEIEQQVQDSINAIDDELAAYEQFLIDKGFKSEETDRLLNKKRKELADDYVKTYIDGQRQILEIDQLSGEDRAAAEQKLHDLKMQLLEIYYENLNEKEMTWAEKALKFIEKWKDAYQQFTESIGQLFAAITNRRLQNLDIESDAVKKQSEEQLEANKLMLEEATKLAGDNLEAQASAKEAFAKRDEAIKEQAARQEEIIERKRRQAQVKQAKLDKAIALSIGAVKLAEAILAMLTIGPAGFALSAVAAAIGAVQLATIAAQPIPAAEKGIRGHKGGAILAGEKGTELIEEPGGKLSFTHDTPHIYDLPAGTNIYSATDPKTTKALAGKDLSIKRQGRQPIRRNDTAVVNEIKDLKKVIKAKPVMIVKGVVQGSKVHNTYIDWSKNAR